MPRVVELIILGIFVLLIAIVILLTNAGFVPPLPAAVLIVFGVLVIAAAWEFFSGVARRRRAMHVLGYVEQAVQHNLPLPRIFNALADEANETLGDKNFANRMQEARAQLEAGAPLARALSEVPAVPWRILDAVAAAERVGRLPQVLHRLMTQLRESAARRRSDSSFYALYPFVVLTVFVFISGMFLVFVAPKFETIFADFGIALPWVTQVTIGVGNTLGIWIFIITGLSLLAVTFLVTRARMRWINQGTVDAPGGWIIDRIPFLARVRSYDALGNVLEFAADAVEVGMPIESALAEASQVSGNASVRRKIDTWISSLLRGYNLAESARAAGIPPLVSGMLATAIHTSDVSQVLRFLARYYSSRFSRARALLRAAFIPATAMILGVCVAWMALSVILPLLALVDTVATFSTKGF